VSRVADGKNHGSDPGELFIDIAWWVNQEVLHHGAEIALLRDLYRDMRSAGQPQLTSEPRSIVSALLSSLTRPSSRSAVSDHCDCSATRWSATSRICWIASSA
jgi:hypothetical protein